jgi:hypothetical protein
MSSYPMCEKMGLTLSRVINDAPGRYYIDARDVELLLSKGQVRYGNADGATSAHKCYNDTHSGLLIGYQKIQPEKPLTKDDLIDMIQKVSPPEMAHLSATFISAIRTRGIEGE